jgi:predicted MPP superfamily phosphohydrolase
MQALWLTDIHLNFVNDLKKKAFFQKIAATDSDCLLISGDIAEGHSFAPDLVDLSSVVQRPIYFVLGNHDFYHSSIRSARKMALGVTAELSTLRYVSENEVYLLTERSALIGHDGWADGRLGRYDTSNLDMNDFQFIKELSALEYG